MAEHGVTRLADGTVRISVGTIEGQALTNIPDQLRAVIAGEAVDPSLRDRLFPAGSREPDIQQEYAELLGDTLAEEKSELLEQFAEGVRRGRTENDQWVVELAPEDVNAWLAVTNDMRHVLSGLVGITSEDAWEDGPDPSDPASMLLWWLGWLQEQLIVAIDV